MQFNKYTHTHTHTHKHTPGKSTNFPSLFPLRPLSPSRAAKAAAGGAQQCLAARREANRQRAAARRQLRRKQQAAVADVLQQQIDEYLASFDPEKPLYQDGWAMGKMQENFQRKSRSTCNLCCLVLGVVVHRCGVLEPRTLRVSFAMHAVCTCKCTFFAVVQIGIRTVSQNHLYQSHSRCTGVLVTCVPCVCTPTPHGRVLKF